VMLSQKKGNWEVETNIGNVGGVLGRNDVAKAVKRIRENVTEGFALLSHAWREEAEC
jgi:hypothetical protein